VNFTDAEGTIGGAAAGGLGLGSELGVGGGLALLTDLIPLALAFEGGYLIGDAIAPYVVDPIIDAIPLEWYAKGERGRTAKPDGTDNPGKKFRWDPKMGRRS
jgi:hypothetical protein